MSLKSVVVIFCTLLSNGAPFASAQGTKARVVSHQIEPRPTPRQFALTERHGPWMIFAGSFAGEGAMDEATRLADEFRRRWRIPAYLYREQFDYSEPVRGIGLDPEGRPIRMQHRLPIAFDEVAVLVGEFPSVDDPKAPKALQFVKTCRPKCLELSSGQPTTLRYYGLRTVQKKLNKNQKIGEKGPLGQAFVVRNPLLPDEYFVPQGIDPFVLSMNEGVRYSLLSCPGKYSVRIATLRGNVVIDQQQVQQIEQTGRMESRLVAAAENAHEITTALRKRNVEAYEFHDRYESVVTVGSFDSLGTPMENGTIELHPKIVEIMRTYGAGQTPIPGRNEAGLLPKSIFGVALDVQPMPIIVPRKSIAVNYSRSNSLFR